MTGLSVRDYAKHRAARGLPGGTVGAVSKALRSNRISRGADGRIDPSQADVQWKARTRAPAPAAETAVSRADLDRRRVLDRIVRFMAKANRETLASLIEDVNAELSARGLVVRIALVETSAVV